MEKNIDVPIRLVDKFSDPMKKVGNATDAQNRKLAASKMKFRQWEKAGVSALGAVAKKAAVASAAFAAIAVGASIAALKKLGSEAIEAAKESAKIGAELDNALRNVDALAAGGESAISAASEDLQKLAGEIAGLGVIGDDETLAGMGQLATMGMGVDSIKELSTAMDDLLAHQYGFDVTADNAKAMATVLGKAMTGSYDALKKYGVVISDADKKLLDSLSGQAKAAKLAELIEGAVGGANEALAKTDEGKIKRLANAWGDAQEEMGAPLLAAEGAMADVAFQFMPRIQESLTGIFTDIGAGMSNVATWLDKHQDVIDTVFDTLEYIGGTIIGGIKNGLSKINVSTSRWQSLIDLAKLGAEAIGEVLEFGIPLALDIISGLAEGILGTITLVKEALQWIADHISLVGDAVSNVLGGPEDGTFSQTNMNGKALGTPYFSGGITKVNERGGEIMQLPSGTQIIPHDVSTQMAAGTSVSLNLTIQGNVIGSQEYAEELGSYITNKVVMALGVV